MDRTKYSKSMLIRVVALDKARNWFYHRGKIELARKLNDMSCKVVGDLEFDEYSKFIKDYRRCNIPYVSLYF